MEYLAELLVGGLVVETLYFLYLEIVGIFLESLKHTVVCHLGGVGDKGEHRVLHIAIHSLENWFHELFAKSLALLVNLTVGTTTEVYSLERACRIAPAVENLLNGCCTVALYNHCMSRLEFLDVLKFKVEGSLQHWALTCQDCYLIINIIKRGTDAPRISHGEHLSTTCNTTHHISAVEIRHCGLEHIAHENMLVDIVGDASALETKVLGIVVVALHLTVESVPHPLEHDITVTIDTRALSHGSNLVEYLIDVGHIEITAKTEVFRLPVVASQERVHIFESALSCC